MLAKWRDAFRWEPENDAVFEDEEEEDTADASVLREHACRLVTSHISEMRLLPHECQHLREEQGLGRIAARYMAWRRTLLITGTAFFALIVLVDCLLLYEQWGRRSPFLLRLVPRDFQRHFGQLVTYHLVQQWGFLAAELASVVTAAVALWHWRRFAASNAWLRVSFACSFLPPFLVLLLVPYRDSVDVKAIMRQICLETSTTLSKRNFTSIQERMRDTMLRSALSAADDFRYAFDIDCDRLDAAEWVPVLVDRIKQEGLLERHDGTCPHAQRAKKFDAYKAFPQTEWSAEHCPTQCLNCTQSCLEWLVPLGTLAGLYGTGSLSHIVSHTMRKMDVVQHCVHCFSEEKGLRCAWRCEGIRLALSLRSLLKEGSAALAPTCVSKQWIDEMQLWGNVLAHPSYWHMLLGTAYAVRSLRWLMPLALSVMIGASYGCRIAKSTIPFSRIPALLNFAAIVFSLPFVFQIAVVVQNIFGGAFTLFGILFTLIFIVASLRPGRLRAETVDDLKEQRSQCDRVMYSALLAAVLCFAASMLTDSLALAWFRLLDAKGLLPNLLELHHMRKEDWWSLLRLVVTLLGTSRVSAVFFADEAVTLMYYFHEGEAMDSADVKSKRSRLQSDIATIHGIGMQPYQPQPARLRRPFGRCCGKGRRTVVA
mmetsp:Transcript_36984/g.74530  ORF Transcript_36984/g.74530 Transcript_36984/m.74530 type:complete len:653 (+) Transcript_36984:101-2059(+)